jgi:hypothetical protein
MKPAKTPPRLFIQYGMGFKYTYLIKEISRYLLEVAFGQDDYEMTDDCVVIRLIQ